MFASLSKNEREFFISSIKAGVRADARTNLESRLLRQAELAALNNPSAESLTGFDSIRFGQENGQVLIKLGQTKVLTQSSLKIVNPKEARPNEGDIRFNVEFAALSHSAEFNQSTNTLGEMRIEVQNFIERVVKNSRVTDKEGLCIVQGKLVWLLTIDLQLINDDGNIIDAIFLAAILAIKNTRIPEVSLKEDKLLISRGKENQTYLNVHHIPVCTTFFWIPKMLEPIVDATAKEERLAIARLSICMNVYEDLCGMQTLGQMEVDPLQLMKCSRVALKIASATTELIRQAWEAKDRLPILEMHLGLKIVDKRKTANFNSAQAFLDSLSGTILKSATVKNESEDTNMQMDVEPTNEPIDTISEELLINKIMESKHIHPTTNLLHQTNSQEIVGKRDIDMKMLLEIPETSESNKKRDKK